MDLHPPINKPIQQKSPQFALEGYNIAQLARAWQVQQVRSDPQLSVTRVFVHNFAESAAPTADGSASPDTFATAVERTKTALAKCRSDKEHSVFIFHEAAFEVPLAVPSPCRDKPLEVVLMIRVDLLQFDARFGTWKMYEVKSSTTPNRTHFYDVGFQWYALRHSDQLFSQHIGQKPILQCALLQVNGEATGPMSENSPKFNDFFQRVDFMDLANPKKAPNFSFDFVDKTFHDTICVVARKLLQPSDAEAVDYNATFAKSRHCKSFVGHHCSDPVECPYLERGLCLPDENGTVFELPGLNRDAKSTLWNRGYESCSQMLTSPCFGLLKKATTWGSTHFPFVCHRVESPIVMLNMLHLRYALSCMIDGSVKELLQSPPAGDITRYNNGKLQRSLPPSAWWLLQDLALLDKFFASLQYPLFFLDFETAQYAIPPHENLSPYQQLPFQYSLHVLRTSLSDAPIHHEFVALGPGDPRMALLESLLKNIETYRPHYAPSAERPLGIGTWVSHNAAFEKGCLSKLISLPTVAPEIKNLFEKEILPFFVDTLTLTKHSFTHKDLHGKWSIKSLLPAVCPDLSYAHLPVKNGGEAAAVYRSYDGLAPLTMRPIATAREELLKYCELDTLAMLELMRKLHDVVEVGRPLLKNAW